MSRFYICALLIALGVMGSGQTAIARQIPQAIQQELQTQNMSEAEARQMASQLGINLDDPVQAAQRARELGVPESKIQEMLRAIKNDAAGQAAGAAVEGVAVIPPPSGAAVTTGEVVVAAPPPVEVTQAVQESTTQAVQASEMRDVVEAQTTDVIEEEAKAADLAFFGYDLFNGIPAAFEPSLTGPVDDGYLVGPGDKLRLTVWGAAEFQYELDVDPEGRVFVPNVGQFTASGRRLEQLRDELKRFLSQSYSGLLSDPPSVYMDLTVTRMRPLQVYVLGEVARPGGYTISPNSTLFNVLYSVGGPLTRGSLRTIDVIRNGRVVRTMDLYKYLLQGYEKNPLRLQTNDFVFVRPRGETVAISGPVRRPAVFELTEGEGFGELLAFAGGLLPDAYAKRFQIERIIPFDERTDASIAREVLDVDFTAVLEGRRKVDLRDGDVIRLFSISDRMENSATVSGPVFQPGQYEISGSVRTVRDLILAADGLTEVAYRERADLIRLREDMSEQFISLDLAQVMADDPMHNIPLVRRDRLQLFSVRDIQRESTVSISGYVRSPKSLPLRADLTLQDLLFAGGGLRDSLYIQTVFLERADLVRKSRDGLTERLIPFHLGDALAGRGMGATRLEPGDEVRVFPASILKTAQQVSISGFVQNPQTIPFREDMTIYDLLFAGGGLLDSVYVKDVFLDRADLTRLTEDRQKTRVIPFNLADALNRQGMGAQLLQPGDAVRVYPRNVEQMDLKTVNIAGAVRAPGQVAYREELTLEDLILEAGGFTPYAFVQSAEISRMVYGSDLSSTVSVPLLDRRRIAAAVSPDSLRQLFGKRRTPLQPGDNVYIRIDPDWKPQVTVSLTGEVRFPGTYSLLRDGERLSEVLRRAGGLTPTALVKGGRVLRDGTPIFIDFESAAKGRGRSDIQLLPGDQIVVSSRNYTVTVGGNVYNPGKYKYVPGKRVRYYVENAGGKSVDSEAVFYTRANGTVRRLRGGLFPANPKVEEGGLISVTVKPIKPEGEKTDVGKIIVDTIGVVGSVLTAIVLATKL